MTRRWTSASGHEIAMVLRQAPPAYRLSVPVQLETEAGIVRTTLDVAGLETTASLRLPARAVAVAVDPDYDLFRRLSPVEVPAVLRHVTLDSATVTVVATPPGPAAQTARRLARRLLDTRARFTPPDPAALPMAPLLVIGTTAEVERLLAGAGLGAVPEALAGEGTARVWTTRAGDGNVVLAVAADDAEALAALLRPLPHYGRQSFLVFEGGKAVTKGIWRPGDSPLRRRLE